MKLKNSSHPIDCLKNLLMLHMLILLPHAHRVCRVCLLQPKVSYFVANLRNWHHYAYAKLATLAAATLISI